MTEMPPPVDDRYRYWTEPPPMLSGRCLYWIKRLNDFGHPDTYDWRIVRDLLSDSNNYDDNAEKFGVYLWEWFHIIYHTVHHMIYEGRDRESRPKIEWRGMAPPRGEVHGDLGGTPGIFTIKGHRQDRDV